MGDSETVVAQTSTVMGYNTYAVHSATDYGTSSAAFPEAPGCEIVDSGDLASSTTKVAADALADNSNSGDGSTHVMHSDSVTEEPPASTTYQASSPVRETFGGVTDPGLEVVSAEISLVSGNGDVTGEATHLASTENGISQENVGGLAAEKSFVDDSAITAEEDRLWSTVRANSLDFNAWTSLIEETEKVPENVSKIRRVYDAFLAEFPLCYGYWKKYADHEARLGSMENVVQVYERAVQGVTYSVDIWLHYCTFCISNYADPEAIRRLFERGLAYVGTDYLSYSLWDKLIEYEYTLQEWSRLAVIYTQILENPNQQLDRYLNSFKELAVNRSLSELRTAEEAASLLKAGGQEIEGDQEALDQLPTPASTGLTEAEELEKYVGIREELYKKTKEFDSKIIGFETAIRRPYFHVRPLNVAELENWHNYLDFIEEEADMSKIVKLYERCLIACANYPEYWIRYVMCMETSGNTDLANNALARATQVFVKSQSEIHLFAARYKERNEDLPGARAAYQFLHSISPGLFEAIVKHANLEHRLGNSEDAISVYEQAIAIENGKEHSQTLAMLFAQYSRFVYLVLGDAERAKDILTGALEHVQPSKPLLEALINLESSQSLPKRIEYLDSLVEKFLVHGLGTTTLASTAEREEISCIFLEFVDQFGDMQSIKKAYNCHAKHFLCRRSTSELGKRHSEDFQTSEKTKIAKSYSISQENGQSVIGAYPAAQNQWETSYGLQPQAWPLTVQAQGQQWIAGYSQQGAYSGYGSTYSNPQLPASVPQAAAYSSYPQTYPVQQTFPQQSYAQPAAVTSASPVQQPTSVPLGYYGSYY